LREHRRLDGVAMRPARNGNMSTKGAPRHGYRPDDDDLLRCLIDLAKAHYDEHLTIMKFPTNWRVQFGNPEKVMDDDVVFDTKAGPVYPHVEGMSSGKTLAEAVTQEVDRHVLSEREAHEMATQMATEKAACWLKAIRGKKWQWPYVPSRCASWNESGTPMPCFPRY
jgi:hypothetical protein